MSSRRSVSLTMSLWLRAVSPMRLSHCAWRDRSLPRDRESVARTMVGGNGVGAPWRSSPHHRATEGGRSRDTDSGEGAMAGVVGDSIHFTVSYPTKGTIGMRQE